MVVFDTIHRMLGGGGHGGGGGGGGQTSNDFSFDLALIAIFSMLVVYVISNSVISKYHVSSL